MTPVNLSVIGVGLIGSRHAELIRSHPRCQLVGICDTDPGKEAIAAQLEVPFYQDAEKMLKRVRPEGAVVATPSALHAETMEFCSRHRVHALIEKPIADTVEAAHRIVDLSRATGTRVLVGYHRRHNPLVKEARAIVKGGDIGRLVAVSVIWALLKPADYYDTEWRTKQPGGGPIMINLVHDLDILRYVCGEIRQVYAHASSTTRGLEVEDSVSVSLTFKNGAVGSVLASDGTAAPWSYEATTQENPYYFHAAENCYHFLGNSGALAFPKMEIWRYADEKCRGWQHVMKKSVNEVALTDPLTVQLGHFCDVVRRSQSPVVDARDAVRSLAVALAVQESSAMNRPVELPALEA
jgi:predicted dehydrogenase